MTGPTPSENPSVATPYFSVVVDKQLAAVLVVALLVAHYGGGD
jgi:hypothetical protein